VATNQEIDVAMVGFQYLVKWTDFKPDTRSKEPKAHLYSEYKILSQPKFVLENAVYKVRGLKVKVSINREKSPATDNAKKDNELLRHEQGHYDITALVARDYVRNILDLSLSSEIVSKTKEAGNTSKDRNSYVQTTFQKKIADYNRQLRRAHEYTPIQRIYAGTRSVRPPDTIV
jgi:hypothetical protein